MSDASQQQAGDYQAQLPSPAGLPAGTHMIADEDSQGPDPFVASHALPVDDKLQTREYVNLIIQSLEDKSDLHEYDLMSENPVSIKKMFGLGVKTIIIDAGHGGEDPGAIGAQGTKEKDITLDITRTLKGRLEERGYRVLLTRGSDKYIPLKARTVIANESGADLFLSVHVNFLPGRSINMIETLYFGPSKNAIETQLAEKENEGSGFSISDYNQLIKKLSSTMKLQESRLLAQSIQQHLYRSMHTVNGEVKDYGVKRAPFVVLLGAEMPGVLVEVSCLSNHDEEQRLRDPAYREAIARYIETGVIKYLESRSTDYDTQRADRDGKRDLVRRD
jgi:N-acetylmuramoyl-L-alanine amidase